MIKVMHVLNTGKFSGAENVAITLIVASTSEVNSTYVSLEGEIEEYLHDNRIVFEPISKVKISEIRRVIKLVQPDIIHAHDFTAGIICALATKKPVINHLHHNPPWIKHYNLRSIVYGLSSFRFKTILMVSDSILNEYVFGKWIKNKSEVIGNPVDVDKVRRLAEPGEIVYDIAFLGRLSPPKNPDLFIDIIKCVKKQLKEVKVIMIGDGEMREEIENRIVRENLDKTIKMVGFQKNPYKYLSQAKILLMPSSWEGYGLAAVEALALGKPVVCSSVGGLSKIVDDSCGRICNGVDEYAEALITMLSNNKYYYDLSSNAVLRSEHVSNIKNYTQKICDVYKRVLLE